MHTFNIAVIPGDGIGKEVMPEALRALDALERRHGLGLRFEHLDWACADYWQRHGTMLPTDWFDHLRGFDAILFGAVGWPDVVPDHVSLWGSLLQFRRGFDQYINLRPVRQMPGVPAPLAGRQPGEIDFLVVRENTEGEYTNLGGRMYAGTEREIVIQESVFSRHGIDRVLKYAFDLAQRRPRHVLTSATKSNGVAISMPYWDERLQAMAAQYPDVTWDKHHIDILCARFVLQPQRFDVVVASNLFGDILSDLGPACTGTIGIAPSANLNPERRYPSLFEPVHGSAPDIYGQNIANPVGMIWSAQMMLEFLGERDAGCRIAAGELMTAIEQTLEQGPRTRDLGGTADTTGMGRAIAERIDRL
ncbi:MAG: tartrate dehydrogenase [Castellaniella sp.]|uniref:tartrate dehydrogenase n=1 Tax=Castellaniella sp. TaxID=1955812 RepID=UPI002A36182A|nr:tartrate dehydrogenase [Castellaniella sp.]MDY0309638.1 tartrate dehydrogenase [Castellaniella sp.]